MSNQEIFESRYRTIFEQSPFSIQIFNPEGHVLLVNPAYKKMWGLSDEFIRDTILKEYNVRKDPILKKYGLDEAIERAFSGEVVEMPEFYYDPKQAGMQGNSVWAAGLFYPILNQEGEIREVVLIHIEATREHNEREQKNRLLQVQSFLSNVTSLLHSTLDYDKTIEQIAESTVPEFCDGFMVDILEDNQIVRLFTKHWDSHSLELLVELQRKFPPQLDSITPTAGVIRNGKPVLFQNVDPQVISVHCIDEEQAQIMMSIGTHSFMAVPLEIRGKIIGALNFQNTSKRKKFDEHDLRTAVELARRASIAIENARLYRKAQQSIQDREDFISIASHELKTPITSLKLQWEVASRSISEHDQSVDPQYLKKLANVSLRQLDRLTRLVEDMLDVGRINTGRFAMSKKPVDLDWIVLDVVDRFSDQLTDLGIELVMDHIESNVKVMCDHFRIEQVITNLLTNAVRYGRKRPITISLEKNSGRAILKVRDQGRGIALEHQAKIFERFTRGISVDDAPGLGLGLYISQEITREHGGELSVESQLGRGSTLTMDLPLL